MIKQNTDTIDATTETGGTIVLEGHMPAFVTVTIVSPTGQETIDVPTAIAQDNDLLRGLLGEHGVSAAANASIERDAAAGTITLTKQADRNG